MSNKDKIKEVMKDLERIQPVVDKMLWKRRK